MTDDLEAWGKAIYDYLTTNPEWAQWDYEAAQAMARDEDPAEMRRLHRHAFYEYVDANKATNLTAFDYFLAGVTWHAMNPRNAPAKGDRHGRDRDAGLAAP